MASCDFSCWDADFGGRRAVSDASDASALEGARANRAAADALLAEIAEAKRQCPGPLEAMVDLLLQEEAAEKAAREARDQEARATFAEATNAGPPSAAFAAEPEPPAQDVAPVAVAPLDAPARIAAILSSDEAKSRQKLALHLALNTDWTPEEVERALAAAGREVVVRMAPVPAIHRAGSVARPH